MIAFPADVQLSIRDRGRDSPSLPHSLGASYDWRTAGSSSVSCQQDEIYGSVKKHADFEWKALGAGQREERAQARDVRVGTLAWGAPQPARQGGFRSQPLCAHPCADRPHRNFWILWIPFRDIPFCLPGISCPLKFCLARLFLSSWGEVGYCYR